MQDISQSINLFILASKFYIHEVSILSPKANPIQQSVFGHARGEARHHISSVIINMKDVYSTADLSCVICKWIKLCSSYQSKPICEQTNDQQTTKSLSKEEQQQYVHIVPIILNRRLVEHVMHAQTHHHSFLAICGGPLFCSKETGSGTGKLYQ